MKVEYILDKNYDLFTKRYRLCIIYEGDIGQIEAIEIGQAEIHVRIQY